MNRYLGPIIVGVIVAGIWGYFADLRHGETGWFVGRLLFVPLMAVIATFLWHQRRTGKDS